MAKKETNLAGNSTNEIMENVLYPRIKETIMTLLAGVEKKIELCFLFSDNNEFKSEV